MSAVCSGHSPSELICVYRDLAIDNRSVRREAVLSNSSSFETAKPSNATNERVKGNLRMCKGSKPMREEAMWREAHDFASSVFDLPLFSQFNTDAMLLLRPRKLLMLI